VAAEVVSWLQFLLAVVVAVAPDLLAVVEEVRVSMRCFERIVVAVF